jgi:aminocarboxymuconate-semialdehyde decarboxylase
LASVPLQDGEMAARLLEELRDEGLTGVMIGTQPFGDSGVLDDPALDPFWSVASAREAVIFIHPMYGCGDTRLNDYDMINAVGRGLDTTTAVARMLFTGHFTKYPGMSVVLPHGGGALPWVLGRLMRNAEIHPGQYADPMDGFRRIYFDTVVFDPDALNFLIAKAGVDKVVLGSDYPFPIGDHTPRDIVGKAGLSEIDTTAILGGTAAKLFRLEGTCTHG